MYISVNRNIVNFRTSFSEGYDLVQKYRGARDAVLPYNNTVDIIEAGLINNEKWDFWHTDIPFSISNDEAPAVMVNGTPIGCNHGQPGGILLYLPDHDKTYADIGSLWKDADGTFFTLFFVEGPTVAFVSENIGASETDYAFKSKISGTLTHIKDGVHTGDVIPGDRISTKWIEPVNRYTKREIIAYTDGVARVVTQGGTCDYAEFHEEYDIVNPASMIRAIRENRPEGGYTTLPQAMGDTMMRCKYIYRIEGDGTTVIDFSYEKVQDVRFQSAMGAMFQEKLNTFGGGVYRYVPKLLPFETPEGTFDFSNPTPCAPGPFPKDIHVTSPYWENPLSPPDKIVDIMRDTDGHDRIGFACGYLPLYDGEPKNRLAHLESTPYILRTRKGYPTFMNGELPSIRGVAYKKYFTPKEDNVFVYTIPYKGQKYMYMDFFKEATLSVPFENSIRLYEKSDAITFEIKNHTLTVNGAKGYAVFICD